ncbi:MAG: NAD-dependent epimerase/dehydratase family protein [Bacteroidia bacterium]
MNNKKIIAVIGSNGFIGSHLVDSLSNDSSIEVRPFGKSDSSKHANYKVLRKNDKDFYENNFKNIDYVYYLASESIPASTWEIPELEIEKNLIPFIDLLNKIASLGVKRIGFLSSAGTVYGLSDDIISENSPTEPFTPYGITKLTMEKFLNYYNKKYGIEFDVFRISNVYGEGQDTSKGLGLINTFIENIITNKKIQVFGKGENVRNFIYVKDVVRLLITIAKFPAKENTIINVASNDSLSLNEIIDLLKTELKLNFNIEYLDNRGSDNKKTLIKNDKQKLMFPDFNYTPINEGLRNTYNSILRELQEKNI